MPPIARCSKAIASSRSYAAAIVLLTCATTLAQPAALNLAEELGPAPRSGTWTFPLRVSRAPTKLFLDAEVKLTAGQLTLRVIDPGGAALRDDTTTGELKLQVPLPVESAGVFQLQVIADQATGHWTARLYSLETASVSTGLAISGSGIILVVIAGVVYWRTRSQARWAWFWVGAAVWTVGVGLKLAWAMPLNTPVFHALKQALPGPAYLPCASIYVGLLTGIFEVGVTLAAALIWRQWAADAGRAVAIGLGAGAFEALLLGLGGLVQAAVLASGITPDKDAGQIVGVALLTPMFWLAGPVERVIAILCHTASRTLTLLAVATHRWRYFWGGFALLSAIDAIAGYFLLSGTLTRHSTWWVELTIAPAAIISIPIITWCVRRWPAPAVAPGAETVAPPVS